MARIYKAIIVPSKIEVIAAWLPAQPWFSGDADATEIIGAYRFDDPEGEVGIEVQLVREAGAGSDAVTWQVPLSYRGEPLAGGEDHLIDTMQHSVLGKRWVYDAVGDPVFRAELARVIVQADTQVAKFLETPDGPVEMPLDTRVQGSGTQHSAVPEFFAAEVTGAADVEGADVIDSGLARLVVTRKIGGAVLAEVLAGRGGALTGHWPGQEEPVPLAALVLGVAD